MTVPNEESNAVIISVDCIKDVEIFAWIDDLEGVDDFQQLIINYLFSGDVYVANDLSYLNNWNGLVDKENFDGSFVTLIIVDECVPSRTFVSLISRIDYNQNPIDRWRDVSSPSLKRATSD